MLLFEPRMREWASRSAAFGALSERAEMAEAINPGQFGSIAKRMLDASVAAAAVRIRARRGSRADGGAAEAAYHSTSDGMADGRPHDSAASRTDRTPCERAIRRIVAAGRCQAQCGKHGKAPKQL
ncbi:hypothetical protein [Reyranella sp.]|uniref:hypothetical protein n=1 Tax=Reyranella sp. TaxID=1929291 RepID=UPI003D0CC35B